LVLPIDVGSPMGWIVGLAMLAATLPLYRVILALCRRVGDWLGIPLGALWVALMLSSFYVLLLDAFH
jgi:hypothetical protein